MKPVVVKKKTNMVSPHACVACNQSQKSWNNLSIDAGQHVHSVEMHGVSPLRPGATLMLEGGCFVGVIGGFVFEKTKDHGMVFHPPTHTRIQSTDINRESTGCCFIKRTKQLLLEARHRSCSFSVPLMFCSAHIAPLDYTAIKYLGTWVSRSTMAVSRGALFDTVLGWGAITCACVACLQYDVMLIIYNKHGYFKKYICSIL